MAFPFFGDLAMLRLAQICATLVFISGLQPAQGTDLTARPEVQAFIGEMALTHGFEPLELKNIFSAVQLRPNIIELMSRPGESKPWDSYLSQFLRPTVIETGLRFWDENAATLRRARREFGVPEEVVVAILGVETRYGASMGRVLVLDALTTLAFDYPRRADFFRGELEHLLLLGREEDLAITTLRGSYAGAIGLPQFMPSSYRRYAVDYNRDGKRDLIGSKPDAIGSVAHYLKMHGWLAEKPIVVRAGGDEIRMRDIVASGTKPQLSFEQFRALNIRPQGKVRDADKAHLVMLNSQSGVEFWLALDNFRAILSYNQSSYYAMAVFKLSEALRQARYGEEGDGR